MGLSLAMLAVDGFEADGKQVEGFSDALLLSARVMTNTPPDGLATTSAAQWLIVAATALGITLVGLFGFVLGNRIRHA